MTQALVPMLDGQGFSDEQQRLLEGALPTSVIKERPGPGGQKLKYITGKTAIDTANRIFGIGKWGYRVLSLAREAAGEQTFYVADVELYVLGCPFPFPGQGEGVPQRDTADQYAKARKEAVTDALKRALRHFGDQFGLCLYADDSLVEDEEGNLIPVKQAHPQKSPVANKPKTTVEGSVQEPSLTELKALCDEVLGANTWQAALTRILGEEIGDIPEDLLTRAHKMKVLNVLMARKQKQAQKAS